MNTAGRQERNVRREARTPAGGEAVAGALDPLRFEPPGAADPDERQRAARAAVGALILAILRQMEGGQ